MSASTVTENHAGQAADLSPGQAFAAAFAADRAHAEVSFDFTITEAHQPSKDRPRLTVRNLLKIRPVAEPDTVLRFWSESRPTAAEADRVTDAGNRREAAFQAGVSEAGVHPIRAWVQIPDALLDDLPTLADYIDLRLLVRLATAENQALTIGPYGLLNHPEIAKLPYEGDEYVTGVLTAFDEIEQSGATGHAMIMNPTDFYHRLLGRGGLPAELTASNGLKISRIRWVRPGTALIGDFAPAVRLLDAGRSVIRVAEPPPGTFARPGIAVCAEIYEGLAVHLPTHIYHVVPADGGS